MKTADGATAGVVTFTAGPTGTVVDVQLMASKDVKPEMALLSEGGIEGSTADYTGRPMVSTVPAMAGHVNRPWPLRGCA